MTKAEIIEVLKKYSYTEKIRGIENDFYMEIIASKNIESIADKLQSKELSDEEINKAFPLEVDKVMWKSPDIYNAAQEHKRTGAKWYREQIK